MRFFFLWPSHAGARVDKDDVVAKVCPHRPKGDVKRRVRGKNSSFELRRHLPFLETPEPETTVNCSRTSFFTSQKEAFLKILKKGGQKTNLPDQTNVKIHFYFLIWSNDAPESLGKKRSGTTTRSSRRSQQKLGNRRIQ